ncbi:hypothetical protein [Nostoc favosum]|nr:hypothetical protein [Nostoc favosum]
MTTTTANLCLILSSLCQVLSAGSKGDGVGNYAPVWERSAIAN